MCDFFRTFARLRAEAISGTQKYIFFERFAPENLHISKKSSIFAAAKVFDEKPTY